MLPSYLNNSTVGYIPKGIEGVVNTVGIGTGSGTVAAPAPDGGGIDAYVAPAYVAPVDPYAQWGGTAAYNNLMSGFNNQKQGIFDSSNYAINQKAGLYGSSIQDAIDSFAKSQRDIDRQSVQNEASKIQGGRDIMSMIGRGLKSGGTMLGNRNAGNSSAAQAIANAYSELGQRQMSTVGNQYASNMEDIGIAQADQSLQMQRGIQKNKLSIDQTINDITEEARRGLIDLDSRMADASMPERFEIEQEKARVRQMAADKLMQYDAQMQTGFGGIKASDRNTNVGKANTQLAAGQADPNLFKYTTQAPLTVQNSGPVASNMPLYTYKSKKQG